MSHIATTTTSAQGTVPDAVPPTAECLAAPLPQITNAREMAPADAREMSRLFLARLKELEEGTREYQYARNTLIEMNISLVRFAARRFTARINAGIELDDVIQVGTIGLIKAIDRFDPDREVEFSTLALPYITGEIKRYFRDTTWAVHVPRRLQELRVELTKCQETLTEVRGRTPSVKEIAAHLELPEEDVIEGLVAANGYTSASLDSTAGTMERPAAHCEGRPLADTVGDIDPAIALFEDIHTLAPLLRELDGRDLQILRMRFAQEMTQAEIGGELGLSQMQVSRLLTRILTRLRSGMLAA
ncbi:B/F/G family RNA polymerase sigma-70 factor [Streptomyces sp. Sge12]|uniref:SigB/SigF/SigG family RNA polymerase sigma factor n=1 Tax=Streptomyces sp. Sge12 TaxID=1972846 RepID=UPI0009C3972D|nr:SigB/SigF/SigG family RNA polymerase sigma factor [Streptomyces sp. Sge12]ARE73380.1 B/F/G family RNA polymerase sigma-70 factor [Streptomyces sp. Sge12]